MCAKWTESWRAPIQQMQFGEDGLVVFPELQKTVRIPEKDAEALRIMLQELGNLAGLAAYFVEPRHKSSIRVSIAGDGLLQYTVNGRWRPCFREIHCEDNWLEFPELGKRAQLPDNEVMTLRSRLQELQRLARKGAEEGQEGGQATGGQALWLVVDPGCVQLSSRDQSG
ncbi:GIP [Symbiodinium pilosum]|uniref:GIP protein n=1 Tax=Symbiodinium pilosum TaxID=2952 RepID=A0A812P9H3_SYMPI|nr:GIP [Symbiodinium pilosum]